MTVNAVDANWNLVTSAGDAISISSSDANAGLPGNAGLAGGTGSFTVTLKTGGNQTVTATDASDGSKAASTSGAIPVGAGTFTRLQLLAPGEVAAPGTASGKTGTPTTRTAGTAFTVTVNAVDANWNVVSTNDTVAMSSSDVNATMPANAALVAGTKGLSVTLKTAGSATLTASDVSNGSNGSNTSPSITVNPGAVTRLQILLPGETAAAGTANGKTGSPVAQTAGSTIVGGVMVNAVDANWNVVSSATPNVTITSSDANAAIADDNGGTAGNMTLVSGARTLSTFTFKTAGTRTITASDAAGALTASTSANVAVGVGSFAKLQLLVPGQTAAPGTASGLSGTPLTQIAFTSFGVTVNAVDANWNLVNTVADTAGIAASDATATLPPNAGLASGTQNFSLAFNTNGSFTVTASDLSDNSKSPYTSPAITVSPAQFTQATGGSAIPADLATGTFTNLTGPVYAENANGDVGLGTIILNAPNGFIFDTGGTAPTVRINGGGTGHNINGVGNGSSVAMTSVTSTQLVFTVTAQSSGGFLGTLTWQNARVRPTAGALPAGGTKGNLFASGTATVTGLSTNSNLGTLREVAGAGSKLAIQTQPSATAVAGVVFAQQPVIQVLDQFSNLRSAANGSSDNTTLVSGSRSAGSGTLQGTTSLAAADGVATYTNLSHNVATNITILFSSGSLASTTSIAIAVSPGAATALAFTTQPGNAAAGGQEPGPVWQQLYRRPPGHFVTHFVSYFRNRPLARDRDAGHRHERRQRNNFVDRFAD